METVAEAVWREFDATISEERTSPWRVHANGASFEPDIELLEKLLSIPVAAGAGARSGLPAKAVDVWVAAELRRAGFGRDEVWPRPTRPRVMSREISLLLESLPNQLRQLVQDRLANGATNGATSADASVLGRAYYKQVDVVVAQWARGPEILISTKRMDSSLSSNALNRIEESYGDAHNLRGRFPLAAIGYILVVRSSAIEKSPGSAARLMDLIVKLGHGPGAYDATAVIIADWADAPEGYGCPVHVNADDVDSSLDVASFFERLIRCTLERTPVDTHVRARELLRGGHLPVTERHE